MATATLRLDIVSAEQAIFTGEVERVLVTGQMGELGIFPGHLPLLTAIKPGDILALLPNKEEEVFYVKGGMLEVQPYIVTILADTIIRASDLDEAAAVQAKQMAEQRLAQKGTKDVDFAKASVELAEAMAQIRAIQKLRKRVK
jgi:F-type H+-transporting ATPase subunit epsilon